MICRSKGIRVIKGQIEPVVGLVRGMGKRCNRRSAIPTDHVLWMKNDFFPRLLNSYF